MKLIQHLGNLYKSLSEEDILNLKQSQNSWEEHLEDNIKFVEDKYIYNNYLGSHGSVRVANVKLKRTRARAIELMEYIFILDRSAVDFIYDN